MNNNLNFLHLAHYCFSVNHLEVQKLSDNELINAFVLCLLFPFQRVPQLFGNFEKTIDIVQCVIGYIQYVTLVEEIVVVPSMNNSSSLGVSIAFCDNMEILLQESG